PVQFAGLVDAVVVDAVATQTYEPTAVAECIARCNAADDAVFLIAEIDGTAVGYLHFRQLRRPAGASPDLYRRAVPEPGRWRCARRWAARAPRAGDVHLARRTRE